MTAREARSGLESISGEFDPVNDWWMAKGFCDDAGPTALALPGFDEFILGYQSRALVLDARFADRICPGGNGIFQPRVVLNGRAVGTWTRAAHELSFFHSVKKTERTAIEAALGRHVLFTGPKAPYSRRVKSAG